MDRRDLHYLLTAWGCYWRELADRMGSTGPSPLAALRDAVSARHPCSRPPAPSYVLEPLPPAVRLVSAAIVIAADQGHELAMRVIWREYVMPRRTQRLTAQDAGMHYDDYRKCLEKGRYHLSQILVDIGPAHRRREEFDAA